VIRGIRINATVNIVPIAGTASHTGMWMLTRDNQVWRSTDGLRTVMAKNSIYRRNLLSKDARAM
jgi:hypothetical protein